MKLASVFAIAACSSGSSGPELACPANVAKELAPPADQSLAFVYRGEGVQKYGCSIAPGASAPAWNLIVPEAKLYDGATQVGTHFAGPSWQGTDGSTAVGRKLASAPGLATAIPWLLLKVSSHNGTPGVFADVTSVQRLETTGGLAPATGCDAAHADAKIDVAYTATYYFYRKTPGGLRCGS